MISYIPLACEDVGLGAEGLQVRHVMTTWRKVRLNSELHNNHKTMAVESSWQQTQYGPS